MLNIKKIVAVAAVALIVASPLAALAQRPSGIDAIAPVTSLGGATSSLAKIVNWIIVVFWILTVLFLIWAAIIYLTAGGDEEKLKAAKSRVIYAVIAAAIALLSTGLQSITTSLLSGSIS